MDADQFPVVGDDKQDRDTTSPDPELQRLFEVPFGSNELKVVDSRLFSPPPGWDSALDPPIPTSEDPPVYKRWWFWTAAGLVLAGGVAAAFAVGSRSPGCPADADCKNAR